MHLNGNLVTPLNGMGLEKSPVADQETGNTVTIAGRTWKIDKLHDSVKLYPICEDGLTNIPVCVIQDHAICEVCDLKFNRLGGCASCRQPCPDKNEDIFSVLKKIFLWLFRIVKYSAQSVIGQGIRGLIALMLI